MDSGSIRMGDDSCSGSPRGGCRPWWAQRCGSLVCKRGLSSSRSSAISRSSQTA